MDKADTMEIDISEEGTFSNPFVFSRPSTVSDPPRVISFGIGSDHVFDVYSNEKNQFTFSAPTIVSQYDQFNTSPKPDRFSKFKPKISRAIYKPTPNVFANALKDTGAFEQLKKNSRSRATRINIANSIICSNVPKGLLVKSVAREYFTKYGNIMKVAIRPRKREIVVAYSTKEEANIAYYANDGYMGEKFHVEWAKSESSLKSPTKKKDLRKNTVRNLLKANDSEIKSELEAMINLEYNLHSQKGSEVPDTNILASIKTRIPGAKTTLLTSKMEKPAAKSEKVEIESTKVKPLSNTSIEELHNIMHQVALTAEDKYKVLEARDRLMRLKRVKPSSLATAKVTSGTCPDMCPEKERLMRESQRQVASYEQLEGNEYRINHVTAIKQYSRSSADQEEPMPHELRPVKSLKMTMSYLLHEIVNLCEQESTNLAEWYHFLWDRTRGIRKDITQQELCCVDSVELIEQCARFHIVCSERLCAEDASVFDKKINSENLTKCLQTLKYMYHDLRMKGVACENEPEFRGYIVLLNLNNGNSLYDLQQLPKSIQKSPEVQFVISMYFALDSNNYSKFFKLVRRTTYLNACILLRYFNQIRVKALSVMVKAYCRKMSTAFPLYELMDILGFENENEARYFCEQMGLSLSNDELHVILNRENFSMPTTNIQQSRACNLIESKRLVLNFSIGQCIANGKMPEKIYKNHKPHNSFDPYGNLLSESINAADQNSNISSSTESSTRNLTEKEVKKMPKLTSIRDKFQTVTSSTQIKKQSINANDELSVRKPMSVSESVSSSIFRTITPEPDVSTRQKQTMPNLYENKSQLTMQSKAIFDKQFTELNTEIASTTYHEDTDNKINSKPPAIFDAFGNKLFANNSNVFSKQLAETSRSAEPATPFAMAVNKSIFSGTGSRSFPTTVFANNRFPTSVSAQQQSANNESIVNKMAMEPGSPKKDHDRKDAQAISELEKIRLEKLEHAKKMRQIEEQSEEIYNDLHAEVTHEFCSVIAKEEVDKIRMCNALSERIAAETISEVIREICDVVLTTEIDHQQKLEAILLRNKNRVIAKCFNAWRQYTLKRRRQREALEDTPVWLQRQSVEECAKMLYMKEQDVAIRNMRKRRMREPLNVADGTENLAPIELIVHNGIRENVRSLDIAPSSDVFWKLVISWPDLSNKTALWYHKKIMNEYLYPNDFTMEPIMKVYRPNQHETLHVCIRHFEGFISERNLIGSDALLFIVDASEEYKSVARRLTRTILSRHKLTPIPLALIVLGDGNLQNRNESIISDLESFLESGYVSEFTIMFQKNLTTKITLNLTQSAILWLAVNRSPANPLEMDYLHNIYDICLSEELWLRILGDSMFNKQLANVLEDPNFIIDLHNEAVNHLMDIILDPESTLYTNFAPEFKRFLRTRHTMPCGYEYFEESWKQDEYRATLETAMNSFLLPPWNAPWPITDIQNLRRQILNYCGEVLSDSNCNFMFGDILSNFSFTLNTSQELNFVHVLLHVIKEKVHLLDEDRIVIYNRNHVKHFRTLPWWFKSNVLTEFISHELNLSIDTSNKPSRKRKRFDRSECDLNEDSSLDEEFDSLAEFCVNTKDQVMKIHFSSKEVESRLQTQQTQSAMLEERLKSALLDEAN